MKASALLERHRAELLRFLETKGRRLLRFESSEDLMQGMSVRVLERGASFVYRDDESAIGWLKAVARSFLADRYAYWSALRRRPAGILRLTAAATTGDGNAAAEPAADITGPTTFAERREMLATAARALALLLPRDRELLEWLAGGGELREFAARHGLGAEAAHKARHRAIARFRKAFKVASARF